MKEGAKFFFKCENRNIVIICSKFPWFKPKPLEFGCKVCVWGQTYLLVDVTEGWLTGAGHLTGDASQINIFDCPS